MSEKKLLIKNIGSLGIVQIVNYIFPLLTIPYVSRILGPSSLGIINYINAFIVYFTLIVGYGFDYSATRKIAFNSSSNKDSRNEVFSEVISAKFLLLIIASILYLISFFYVNQLNKNPTLSLIIYLNVISVFLSPYYIYQGLQNLSLYSIVNLIRGVLSTVLIFILIKREKDYIIYAAITVILNVISSLFFLIYAIVKYNLKFRLYGLKHSVKLLKSDRYIFFSSIIWSLYTSTNTVILGFFVDSAHVGFYTVAVSLITIIQSVINTPLTTSLYPFLANSFSLSIDAGIEQLRKIAPIVFYFTLLSGFFILLFAPLIINIVYGEKFHNSIICLMLLSFMPLVSCMVNLFGIQVMYNLKMDKDFVKITFVGAILSVFLNLFFCYYFGYIGPCIVLFITESFILIKAYIKLKKMELDIIKLEYFRWSCLKKNILSFISK